MQIVNFKNSPEHRNIILDAALSQSEPFDSVQIMRYISKNEKNGLTFDHHDIGFFLDEMDAKKVLCRSKQSSYFTKYEVRN